jgi:amino acid adenylation domain-containing protein
MENGSPESAVAGATTLSAFAELRGARLNHFTERPFPRLFEDQVRKHPDQIAVACERNELSFDELNLRANQLARHLRGLGAGRESLVGICIDRTLDMAVGILGILKAGAAYLPLDPEYPKERLAFMLDDARPSIVLAKSALQSNLPENESRIVLIDDDWAAISEQSGENLEDGPLPFDLAYVIYTSGSTGQPKGVMISHANLANYLLALNHELQITHDDLYLHLASIAFSSSRRQLMLPLSQGATVVIATSDERKDPLALFEMIKARGVTIMDGVPSFWRNCTTILASLDDDERARLLDNRLRLMLSASEPLWSDIPRTWMSKFKHPAQHVHMFGQTETAGIVSLYHLPTNADDEIRLIPIGSPIANSEIYILDEEQRPCQRGEAGELYIGGAGVGRGYLNRPELTAEKFIAHPFDARDGARLYRTGDWARCNLDGQIEFTGRRDQQVKLRGFRVELGEVEAALIRHPAIRQTAVVARTDQQGNKKLSAYFVADSSRPSASDLRRFLLAQLPDYAVPSVFVQLDALPLSANGKVNRLALPETNAAQTNLSSEYLAPRNDTENRLAAIWAEVLGVTQVGINDNFFELGGHSLLAAQIVARLRREFGYDLPLRVLFECPTISLIAECPAIAGLPLADIVSRSIQPVERNGEAPLSFTQQQFWLLGQSEPDSASYNVRTAIKIAGFLNIQKLRQALTDLVDRHEILRTNIVVSEGSPMQLIKPSMNVVLDVSDLRQLSEAERAAEIKRVLAAEADTRFDLGQGPLWRSQLMQLGDAEQVLILTIHHIICDGWSVGVLLRELVTLYENSNDEHGGSLPPLPIQYADFAVWQRTRLDEKTLAPSLRYWRQQLAGASPRLDLPTDYPRPETPALHGARLSIKVPAEISQALKTFSQQQGTTLFMTLLAAFQILLFRYSGQEDVVVGTPVAGRIMLETESLIGAFVNTLVLRGQFLGNPTCSEYLSTVRETTLGAFSHQDVPFEKLVQELNPERSLNRSPLFQVMFALKNSPAADLRAEGLTLTPLKLNSVTSKFDLSLEAEEDADGLCLSCEYNADLFVPATIERMLGHLQNLLEAILADPAQRVADLPLLGPAEREKVLVEWNETRGDILDGVCIHQLFEAQVEKTPAAIAAEFNGCQMSYAELNERTNRLAHYLRRQGVGPEVLVGICVDRSLEMLVAMLGVLKAGGAYVPLDPAYPRERITFMIEDAGLTLVLTQESLVANLAGCETCLISIDDDWKTIAREGGENPANLSGAHNLAYVIYTSGSTGNPKGVMIEQRSLVNFSASAAVAYSIGPGDRVLQFASICFDLSVEEIYPALTHGATLVLRTPEMISSARDFLAYCEEWRLTILDLPTAYWHDLIQAVSEDRLSWPAPVRLVIIGGEKASFDRVNTWRSVAGQTVRLVNTYGPTEATVVATMCELGRGQCPTHVVPIGRPIRNARVFVLDKMRQPVPIGIAGELYIGGPGVARGYVHRPGLTSEKFVSDPFAAESSARLYRSGDLVRYLADGSLEFLGRVDNQVKIRGFRIELEEVEAALRGHPDVNDCAVVLNEDSKGDKNLVAYLVSQRDLRTAVSDLRNFLTTKLPAYMVPTMFVEIESLPLSPNGKIDRRALPAPAGIRAAVVGQFAGPADELEIKLTRIWERVMGITTIGVDDNFFDLGGHSLLAVRLFALIQKAFDRNLPLATLFQAPSVRQLANVLRKQGWSAPWSSLVMIQPALDRKPFFCVHAAGGNVIEYHDLARCLGPDQPFYGLQAKGLDGKAEPHKSIREMAAHYIREMREAQAEGPYLIGGRSSGGTIAFEMACQLAAIGERVALLALLDTFPAGYFKLKAGSGRFRQRSLRYLKKLGSHRTNLRRLNLAEKIAYLLNKLKYAPEKTKHKLYRRVYQFYERFGRPLPEVLKNIEEINFGAVKDYEPQTYAGDVTLFLASDLTADYDLLDGWRELVSGEIATFEISGDHNNIIKEPHVRALAAQLRACLDNAQAGLAAERCAA